MLDELYKLDYEDIIGDMPTRFSYRKVEPNSYGLSPEEVLYSRDTTLKQFVSLKKMAPYREDDEYRPDTRKRRRFREMAKQDYDEFEEEYKTLKAEEEKNTVGNSSNKKKRRRQKKGSKKATNETDSATNVDGEKVTESTKVEEKETKKRRKKKGKKLDKRNGIKESESNAEEVSNSKKKEEEKEKSKTKKQKNEKEKKRKKKKFLEGISDSRLASYGL